MARPPAVEQSPHMTGPWEMRRRGGAGQASEDTTKGEIREGGVFPPSFLPSFDVLYRHPVRSFKAHTRRACRVQARMLRGGRRTDPSSGGPDRPLDSQSRRRMVTRGTGRVGHERKAEKDKVWGPFDGAPSIAVSLGHGNGSHRHSH